MLKQIFYQLDLIIGFGSPILAFLLYRSGKIDKLSWSVFWIGTVIGLTWEIPMFIGSHETTCFITLRTINPYPGHYLIFLVSHTLWDGGLFLIGYWLVLLLSKSPRFGKFSAKELIILILYGQAQELLVEIGAISNSAWTFIELRWNPALFYLKGHPLTLYPQLSWLFGSLLFYFILLKIKGSQKK